MTGRKLSSSGSSLPAPKKQHQKESNGGSGGSGGGSGGNGRRHPSRRGSMYNTPKTKDATIPGSSKPPKTTGNGGRKVAKDVPPDSVTIDVNNQTCLLSDDDAGIANTDTGPHFNVKVFQEGKKTNQLVQLFTVFNDQKKDHAMEEEHKPHVKSVLRLVKNCLDHPDHGGSRMAEFPACCFGLIPCDDAVGNTFNTVQIIGLGLRLKELL